MRNIYRMVPELRRSNYDGSTFPLWHGEFRKWWQPFCWHAVAESGSASYNDSRLKVLQHAKRTAPVRGRCPRIISLGRLPR